MADAAPPEVLALVGRFAAHVDAYHRGRYNETQLRREFVDPLFQALGWDVDNSKGYAEAYKDVIHEDAIKVGGMTKAPDYGFRIGGVRKFFVEAKKPSVDIRGDPGPAYQLRRYAWSAKLPLSILTDFEELAVYDCRVRPARTDKPSKARTLLIHYESLPDRWDELASVFARDAILKGSFDKYAESTRRKRGTAEVDEAFLAEIEAWRDALARNIALRNPGLSQRDLNFAVQRTIDRIVFLRISEDRGIEPYGALQGLINGPHVYRRLFERFERADERYNSGLFHFTREKGRPEGPDELTPALTVDDKVLRDILANLYYPESPYEFSVLPADILGHVYERFLGKVIRLTRGHRAKVEEKPEVRKAGGVYYTPTYIVDYIVRHTVGALVEGKTPQEVGALTKAFRPSRAKGARPLTVLDPACGSGSFLLGAYQFLLDWYRDRYIEDGPEKHAAGREPRLYPHASGEWRLSTAERKRILLAHIHGVDIDGQAVEVTKLSLLLKVLEGESDETLGANLRLFHQRALPDLAANIKCGNSLIAPDFYEGRQMALFDEDERLRINAFDWNAEFPEIMAGGGFDAVIGNPPYGAAITSEQAEYIRHQLPCFAACRDSYIAFIEQGMRLLHDGGHLGMIIPSALLGGPSCVEVRRQLLAANRWTYAVLLPYDVFGDAYIDTCIICLRAQVPEDGHCVLTYEFPKRVRLATGERVMHHQVAQEQWTLDPEARITLDPDATSLMASISERSSMTLVEAMHIRRGVLGGPQSFSDARTGRHCHRYFEGDVYRYQTVVEFRRHIAFDDSLREKPRDLSWFCGPRILLRRLVNRRFRLMASYAEEDYITNKNLYSILPKGEISTLALLALLNSTLISYLYVKRVTQAVKDDFAQVTIKDLSSLPCPEAGYLGPSSRLNEPSRTMLDLQKNLAAAKTGEAKTAIQRQIDATDRQIDRLVYDLYGLTDEEIRIVEDAAP